MRENNLNSEQSESIEDKFLISSARSREELYNALNKIGTICEKDNSYDSSTLIDIIEKVFNSEGFYEEIPEILGIRAAVEKISEKETGEKFGLKGEELGREIRFPSVEKNINEADVKKSYEPDKTSEMTPEDKIILVQTVDELKSTIGQIDKIEENGIFYTALEMNDLIDKYFNNEISEDDIPQAFGIRDRIAYLSEKSAFDKAWKERSDTIKEIEKAANFDELYGSLNKVGNIQGSNELYTAADLIGLIDRVRKSELELAHITRSYGLRKKVEELKIAEIREQIGS